MTQKDSVIEALIRLNGEGDLEEIEYMAKRVSGADWSGTKRPGNTMRRILTEGKNKALFEPFERNGKTWYRLLPHMQRQAQLLQEEEELAQLRLDHTETLNKLDLAEKENETLMQKVLALQQELNNIWTAVAKRLTLGKILDYCRSLKNDDKAEPIIFMLYQLLNDLMTGEVRAQVEKVWNQLKGIVPQPKVEVHIDNNLGPIGGSVATQTLTQPGSTSDPQLLTNK